MKNKFLFLILVIAMAIPSFAQGGRKRGIIDGDHYHFGYVSGHVGYSILDIHSLGVLPLGNVGGGVGFGYEYRNSGLWANVGVQVSFHRSKLELDPYSTLSEKDQTPYRGLDTQGKSTTFIYDITETDEIQWNFFDVPILFGYYTHGFHIGAGIKISYALSTSSHATGVYDLKAWNDDLQCKFQDMPEHGYTEYKFDCQQDNRLKIGVSLIGEIGYDLLSSVPTNSSLCNVLKLSFYFEYGLNPIVQGWEEPQCRIKPTKENMTQATINPYLNTVNSPGRVVPFFAGAKLTYMIGGSRTARAGRHHGCMCYN